jgi:hypothetical protein
MSVWQGKLAFSRLRRKGPMLIGTATDGSEICWEKMDDLVSFRKTQGIIAHSTNKLIASPPKGQITRVWEAVVGLMLRIASEDAIQLDPLPADDVREWLRLFWRAAERPLARDNKEIIAFMRRVQTERRNPRFGVDWWGDPENAPPPVELPPCVFITADTNESEGSTFCHLPSFRSWLSVPGLVGKTMELNYVRNGLLLLGFLNIENFTRRTPAGKVECSRCKGAGQSRGKPCEACKGTGAQLIPADKETLCLWRGPLSVLQDDGESADESAGQSDSCDSSAEDPKTC